MNKKMIQFLMAGAILILSPFATAQTYDSELMQYGIQFSPPSGWIKVNPQKEDTDIGFKHPQNKAVIAISYPRKANIASFQMSLVMLRMNKKPKEKKIEFLGETCYVFDIEQTNSSGIKTFVRDYQFLKNNKLYTIDYISSANDFDNYLLDFENSLSTFKIITPNK